MKLEGGGAGELVKSKKGLIAKSNYSSYSASRKERSARPPLVSPVMYYIEYKYNPGLRVREDTTIGYLTNQLKHLEVNN